MGEWAVEGFGYELWANREWAAALDPIGSGESLASPGPWPDFPKGDPAARARDVFLHILWAQRIWLMRCGRPLTLEGGPQEWTQALHDGWVAEVGVHEADEVIDYQNCSGEPFTLTFREIVAHVLRHGAYHRGQLREIFESIRPDDIPQT